MVLIDTDVLIDILIDALIAACAVGLQATLYGFNVKHYKVVPGLSMEQPYER